MKSEDLLRHLSAVDDKFVDELAENSGRVINIKKISKRKKILAIAASLALVITGGLAAYGGGVHVGRDTLSLNNSWLTVPMAENSVIMIDVNPSIKLEVDDRGVVVEAQAVNDDAEEILAEVKVVGEDYQTAVTMTVSALCDEEYLTELKNSILVTAESKDENQAEALRVGSVESIQQLDEEIEFNFSILSQCMTDDSEYAEASMQFGISEGRVQLISKFCAEHEDFTLEELAECNIQTLNQLFEYTSLPEAVERIGAVAGIVPEEMRDELKLDELDSGDFIDFVDAISDFYDKLCEYYSVSEVAKQIGYAIDISEGENDDGTKLWAVLAESLKNGVGTNGAIINRGESTVSDWFESDTVNELIDRIENLG